MKNQFRAILIAVVSVILTSCASSFYQVYDVKSTGKMDAEENFLVYEDEYFKISYNLWSEGGNIGFECYNKTDKSIILNMEESYFIFNDIAYDYYKDRIYTKSISSGASTTRTGTASKSVTGVNYLDLLQTNKIQASRSIGLTSSSGYSISYNEQKIIRIPAKTSKIITEYDIIKLLYRDCDLLKYPAKKDIKSMTFTESESPIKFSNRIAYFLEDSDDLKYFENEFYVSAISNYPEKEFLESKYEVFCGQKSKIKTYLFKEISPSKFYVKYSKGQDYWKH